MTGLLVSVRMSAFTGHVLRNADLNNAAAMLGRTFGVFQAVNEVACMFVRELKVCKG